MWIQSFIVSDSSFGKTLIIRTFLSKQQCVISMAGFCRFTKAAKPLPLPTIAEVPSVQMLMQSVQFISWAIKIVNHLKNFLTGGSL